MDPTVGAENGTDLPDDQEELYAVIRSAVRDALNEVIGTLILAIVAIMLLWSGTATIIVVPSPFGLVFGAGFCFLALLIAGAAVGRVPKYGDNY